MEGVEELTLAAAFTRGQATYHKCQTGGADEDTVAAGVALLRHAVAQVDRAGVFSSNETKEDIATSDLKYVLAPFYLGEVVARTRTPDPSSRLPVVTEAAECHELFLSSCEQHELLSEGHVAARAREAPPDPATARAEKVGRFKREKAIRTRLDELDLTRRKRRRREQALADADWDDEEPEEVAAPEDEEEERERWLLLIEDAANRALDAKPHFDMELEMLRNRELYGEELERNRPKPPPGQDQRGGMRGGGANGVRGMGNVHIPGRMEMGGPGGPGGLGGFGGGGLGGGFGGGAGGVGGGFMGEGRSIPPELLAAMAAQGGGVAYSAGGGRDVTAREVFRPSHILPTMTIEEAGEIEYQELMERTVREAKNKMRAAAEEAAMTADEKDDRDLAKARSWDEFKDDNPFGAGNSKLRPCS